MEPVKRRRCNLNLRQKLEIINFRGLNAKLKQGDIIEHFSKVNL